MKRIVSLLVWLLFSAQVIAAPFSPHQILTAQDLNNALAGAAITSGTISGATISSSPISGSTGSFTTLASPSVSLTGGLIDGVSLGTIAPAAGAFTNLSSSGTVSGTGFSTYLASPPAIGGTVAGAGSFTTLSASSTVSGTGFSTYLASPPAIGGTVAGAGSFTTLSASSTVSGTGFSTYLASPPAIGGTVAGAGSFTTLSASSTVSGTGFSTYLASPPAIGGTVAAAVTGTTVTASTQFSGPGTGLTGTAAGLSIGGNAATATTATTALSLSGGAASEKVQTIGATQATGALTFTVPNTTLDFRSTTLTSGTVSTVNGTPANLVLPSGGTLGATSGVSARIVLVLVNNAGTMEQAVVNLAGGNDLSETGVINTTAISATSTANNVFYSTAARTGVAYKVVGLVDAVNTAGAWGNPTLIQGQGSEALKSLQNDPIFGTAVATTSGTSIDFTGIPSWVKRITVLLNGVSTNGTSAVGVQIGSGSVLTSGYFSSGTGFGATSTATTQYATMFGLEDVGGAANVRSGTFILSRNNDGTGWWGITGTMLRNTQLPTMASGGVILSGTLDRIRLTTLNGTDVFDAGFVNIMYE